ncbi:unnamed protein product [Pipistrellus nathusii]|uniref:Uncharacterized protein n=1 Tax=Pipistrellus nathusii TaxID=59473 RepID=A0ABN9Z4I0_PIPNA
MLLPQPCPSESNQQIAIWLPTPSSLDTNRLWLEMRGRQWLVNWFTFCSLNFSRVVVLPDHSMTLLGIGYLSIAIHKITFRKCLVFKCSLLYELPIRIDWQQWDVQEKMPLDHSHPHPLCLPESM